MRIEARRAEEAFRSMEKHDFLAILHSVRSPFITKISNWVAAKSGSQERKTLVHWFFSYITHPPALLVFAISIAGFLSCLFQIILLNELRKAEPMLLAEIQNVDNMISAKIQNSSAVWINGTNKQISSVELDINENLLGWARQSTQSLNNTLNTCKYDFTTLTDDSC